MVSAEPYAIGAVGLTGTKDDARLSGSAAIGYDATALPLALEIRYTDSQDSEELAVGAFYTPTIGRMYGKLGYTVGKEFGEHGLTHGPVAGLVLPIKSGFSLVPEYRYKFVESQGGENILSLGLKYNFN